jgi:hypothetical protein
MTNWILPTNATCCNGISNVVINATCCVTCCDGAEDAFPPPTKVNDVVLGLIAFSLVISVLCLMAVINARLREKREKLALQEETEENVASQERKEERKRKLKEFISNGLIVKEWVPDDAPVVQSTESDQDNPPSGEAVEASQPPAPLINSSLVSCAMGSDDCKSSAGEGEIADCAICLSHFKPQQLVCESNNSSCQHVFHKDCMVDWLMKKHNDCPLCREVYLIKAV